jgi:rhamnulokinase
MDKINVLALDLGAESGRAIVGRFDGHTIELQEVHRFPNLSVRLPDGLHWDILYLFNEVKKGIRLAFEEYGDSLISLGIDTWGVDHALLDANGHMTFLPYHYRDSRTDVVMEEVFSIVPKDEIFFQTGIQFMPINTLYQLRSLLQNNPHAIESARTFLTIPDLLNYWLTGKKVSEFSIATTTQCYDPTSNNWAYSLLERIGVPGNIFPEIVPSGTNLGNLLPYVTQELGAHDLQVVAPACHDTASAVLSIPKSHVPSAYLSSGTWSLLGIETRIPIINQQSLAMNFTNEGSFDGSFRFLKNITGLWIVQECKRYWQSHGHDYSYNDLTDIANAAQGHQAYIDTEWPEFLKPGNMPEKIRQYCALTNQPVPEDHGSILRCVLESLALKYKEEFDSLEAVTDQHIQQLNIVGGGSQNTLLNQFAANALNRKVVTGPVEATAFGNILGQLIALGKIETIDRAKEIVSDSCTLITYQPQNREEWKNAYQTYTKLVNDFRNV